MQKSFFAHISVEIESFLNQNENDHYPILHMSVVVKYILPAKCFVFLADRTNGRTYATVLRLSSSVVCL